MRIGCRIAGALALMSTVLLAAPVRADSEGTVSSVQGDTIHVLIPSGATVAVGDTVTVMNWPDRDGNATHIGRWQVTEVRRDVVIAVPLERFGVQPSEGMRALIRSSRGPGFIQGSDVRFPGSDSSFVPGKVTEVRGRDVTIQLDRGAFPVVGDRVELSFSVGEDTIVVGAWRVSGVRDDGRVDAEAVDARGEPTPTMDAAVFATGAGHVAAPQKARADAQRSDSAAEIFAEGVRLESQDAARALELFVKAAGLGHAEAAEKAGMAYHHGLGAPRDDVAALRFFRQAAEAGRAAAQNNYAAFLATGRGGVAVDVDRAVEWYRKAAAQGNSLAQSNLCIRYGEGQGVEKDLDEALRLCRLAAAQDHPKAFDRLGWMYQFGLGVAVDLAEAFRYYERSAKLGDANGQNNLGYLYEQGWGVNRDLQQALYWYRQAAAQRFATAEWNLGRMHMAGLGVPADERTAVEYYRRAARGGHDVARKALREKGLDWR